MNLIKNRVLALEKLGLYFQNIKAGNSEYHNFFECLENAKQHNAWFQLDQCLAAFKVWGDALSKEKINKWVTSYDLKENQEQKTIAVIMAGNIPLVGLHDLISIWISGNIALVKCASKDQILMPFVADLDPIFKSSTIFTTKKIEGFNAVIATGGNNAARYFDYYFSQYPHIIRKNRNGVAVLKGNESKEEYEALGKDLLQYYGMGCRNVSKLYVPEAFDLNLVFEGVYPLASVLNMNKYANNYDYNKAVFLMSGYDFVENGFFMIKKDKGISSPIACAFYEYYEDIETLEKKLETLEDKIQCLVSIIPLKNAIPFGHTQQPQLWDYADGIDTMTFLIDL